MGLTLQEFNVKFGTSGARGLVEDFTETYCWTFSHAFLKVLGYRPRRLIVGHDLRPSSPAIASACMAAVEAVGVTTVYAGVLPTPALALASEVLGIPSIMVTGSHIPVERNGLKAYRPDGEISKADEQAMLAAVVEPPPRDLMKLTRQVDPTILRCYVARYKETFPPDALQGMRVAIYEHSSVARDILQEILHALGAETLPIGRSDEFLAVDTEAVREEDRALAQVAAKSYGFDAIVSADGDADRPLVGDESGSWLRGDVLGILCAKAIGAGTVVTTVSSNTALEKSGLFAKTVRTCIGSPYVITGMKENSAFPPVIGFEPNGGFLLGSNIIIGDRELKALVTRDAVLPIILSLSLAWRQGIKLSKLADSLPRRFTHSDRLQKFAPGRAKALTDWIAADHRAQSEILAPNSGSVSSIDMTDGLRVTFENDDIVHLRASGNAPELRCYVESDTTDRAEALCAACLGRIAALSVILDVG